eukprot:14772539-Heterocapsa_arctica.AAC.1
MGLPGFLIASAKVHLVDPWVPSDTEPAPVLVLVRLPEVLPGSDPTGPERGSMGMPSASETPHARANCSAIAFFRAGVLSTR